MGHFLTAYCLAFYSPPGGKEIILSISSKLYSHPMPLLHKMLSIKIPPKNYAFFLLAKFDSIATKLLLLVAFYSLFREPLRVGI